MYLQITINQRTTNNVTKKRNYCTKLSKNVELKHQEEHWDQIWAFYLSWVDENG